MSKKILTIEQFHNGDESKFLIQSAKEIQLILRSVAQKESTSYIYFNQEQSFIKSTMLAANEKGIWLDVGPDEAENRQLLKSGKIMLVALHNGAKIQFSCDRMEMVEHAARPAFFCPVPDSMIRLQRRDYFRTPIPADTPLTCSMAPKSLKPVPVVEVPIIDISVGGVALSLKVQGIKLEAGEIYPDCHIKLPELGTMVVTIRVKNIFEVVSSSGKVSQHAGCEFVQLDGKMSILLQRYVGIMQGKLSALR